MTEAQDAAAFREWLKQKKEREKQGSESEEVVNQILFKILEPWLAPIFLDNAENLLKTRTEIVGLIDSVIKEAVAENDPSAGMESIPLEDK